MANQYFIGNVGTAAIPNYQLFVTNGTAGAGTHTITSGGASFGTLPTNLTVSGTEFYFTATDSSGATEVWSTDGTTVTKLDPNPTSASDTYRFAYYLTPFITASGVPSLAFIGNVGTAAAPNYQLFVTNGAPGAGTKAVTSGGASFGTLPNNLTVSGNKVYFTANDASGNVEVWATDGTTVTRLDPNPNSASDSYINAGLITPFITAAGVPSVAFVANAGTVARPNYQLYVTNGTAGSGTVAITSGGSGFGTIPANLTTSGSKVYFTALDSANNIEVWVTDGATVTKLDPNPNSASDTYVQAFNLTPFITAAGVNELAFTGNVGTLAAPNYQLFATNGTNGAGTVALTSGGNVIGSLPQNLTVSGNKVYFTAIDSAGNTQAWATDGITVARLDPNPNSASDTYRNAGLLTPFVTAAGVPSVAFIANVGTTAAPNYQLFSTNGTAGAGTVQITTGGSGFGTIPANLTVSGNKVYFTALDSSNGIEVWATDGATVSKLDPNPNSASDTYVQAYNLTPFTNASGVASVAFIGNVGTLARPNYQLFVTTGTNGSGVHAVTTGGASFGSLPGNLTVNGSKVYFTATDSSGGTEVWVTDGVNVTKLDPNPTSASDSYVNSLPFFQQTFAIAPLDASKAAATSGTTPYTFSLTREGNSFAAATLAYTVTGSGPTAAPASLFANSTGTITFGLGTSVTTLTLNVNGTALTADEGFTVTLGGTNGVNPVSATSFIAPTATGTILHNTGAGTATTTTVLGSDGMVRTISLGTPALASLATTMLAGTTPANLLSLDTGGVARLSTTQTAAVVAATTPVSLFNNMLNNESIAAGSGPFTFVADQSGSGTLIAGAGNDLVSLPGGGNWTVALGNGADTIAAPAGSHNFTTGTAGSLVFLGAGSSTVTALGADTILGATGATNVTAIGNKNALVFALSGPLNFTAGGGTSTVDGGTAGETVTGAATGGTLVFGTGATRYTGMGGTDTVVGLTGSATIQAGAGGGLFAGGSAGNNVVSTSGGNVTAFAGGAGDVLTASGAGNNLFAGRAGAETLSGAGSTATNSFFAGSGNQSLVAGSGNTALAAGSGADTLVGGSGLTLFVFTAGATNGGMDTVVGFDAGHDFVQLAGYSTSTASVLQNAKTTGSTTVLSLGDGTKISFVGVTSLNSSSFI